MVSLWFPWEPVEFVYFIANFMRGVVVSCYCFSPVEHPSVLPLPFFFLRIATQSVRFVLPSAFFFHKYIFLIITDTMKPRYNERTFFLSLGPSLYRGTTVLCSMHNCGQWRYVLQCFVKWPKLWVHIDADPLFCCSGRCKLPYDLLVKFTRKFFFMISSALHLKYHNEEKRKITNAFQSIYLSGNFPE